MGKNVCVCGNVDHFCFFYSDVSNAHIFSNKIYALHAIRIYWTPVVKRSHWLLLFDLINWSKRMPNSSKWNSFEFFFSIHSNTHKLSTIVIYIKPKTIVIAFCSGGYFSLPLSLTFKTLFISWAYSWFIMSNYSIFVCLFSFG